MSKSKNDRAKVRKKSPPAKGTSPKLTEQRDHGLPGGGKGRVDITGVAPDDFHVDPNITEGHPGYDESGPSEIVSPKGGKTRRPDEGKKRSRLRRKS